MWVEDECGGWFDFDLIEWFVEFNLLWNVDSKIDVEIRKFIVEIDKIYIEVGVFDFDDVYEVCFGCFGIIEIFKFNVDSLFRDELDKMVVVVYENYK